MYFETNFFKNFFLGIFFASVYNWRFPSATCGPLSLVTPVVTVSLGHNNNDGVFCHAVLKFPEFGLPCLTCKQQITLVWNAKFESM